MRETTYSVVLYGASGFVGKQTVRYFAERVGDKVLWAIADVGDPGNRATVKFVCESALCLAVDFDKLPGGAERGGILTPATGLGNVLVERLRQAGMQMEFEMMPKT